MSSDEFRQTLERAVAGNHEALERILEMYMPLIDHNSIINGQLDEDCRQYILIHIALNISKFII